MLCFWSVSADQAPPEPPVTPSVVANRKPAGEEAGLSSPQGDGVDKHCSSKYMHNTTTEIVEVFALRVAALRLDYFQVMGQGVLGLRGNKGDGFVLHGQTL